MSETAQVVEAREAAAHRAETHPATLREYIESLLVTVILALFGTTFVVQAFKIPSQSMEPTLLVGDHLLVNKFIFGGRGHWYDGVLPYREVRRGDIIVFKFPFQDHPHYVKRVIGVPGDHIKIVDQQVYVNGKRISEPYIVRDPAAPYDPFGDNFPPRSRANICRPTCSRNGPIRSFNTSTMEKLSSHRTNILPWEITAITVGTAGSGDSWIATQSWGGQW